MRASGTVVVAVYIAALLFVKAQPSSAAGICSVPVQAAGEWPTASLEHVHFDPRTVCSLNEELDKAPEMNVHAVVVVRDGALVFEAYRAGEDEKWGAKLGNITHTADTLHDTRSVSKSVVSLLIGIAIVPQVNQEHR